MRTNKNYTIFNTVVENLTFVELGDNKVLAYGSQYDYETKEVATLEVRGSYNEFVGKHEGEHTTGLKTNAINIDKIEYKVNCTSQPVDSKEICAKAFYELAATYGYDQSRYLTDDEFLEFSSGLVFGENSETIYDIDAYNPNDKYCDIYVVVKKGTVVRGEYHHYTGEGYLALTDEQIKRFHKIAFDALADIVEEEEEEMHDDTEDRIYEARRDFKYYKDL